MLPVPYCSFAGLWHSHDHLRAVRGPLEVDLRVRAPTGAVLCTLSHEVDVPRITAIELRNRRYRLTWLR